MMLWTDGGSAVDEGCVRASVLHTPAPASLVRHQTCGTLGTTVRGRVTPLTSGVAGLSPIHSTYYHHHLLISTLSGESEHPS